jgi:hypothetical protein
MSLLPNQPREVARLLNPAFCGAIIQQAVEGFQAEAISQAPMPLPLTYLVLPIVFHEPTRDILPASKATKFSTWILRHPEVRAGFADRVSAMLPFTTAAVKLLIQTRVLAVTSRGRLYRTDVRPRGMTSYPKISKGVGDCWSRALLFGKMMASTARVSRIFISLGVRL